MATRAAARREAVFLTQANGEKPILSGKSKLSPVVKPKSATKTASVPEKDTLRSGMKLELDPTLTAEPRKLGNESRSVSIHTSLPIEKDGVEQLNGVDDESRPFPKASTKKAPLRQKTNVVNGEAIKGGWCQMPHNMGPIADNPTEGVTIESFNPIPRIRTRILRANKAAADVAVLKSDKGANQDSEIKKEESLGSTDQDDSRSQIKSSRKRYPKKNVQDFLNSTDAKIDQAVKDEVFNTLKQEDLEGNKVGHELKRKATAPKSTFSAQRIKRLKADDSKLEDTRPKTKRSGKGFKKIDTSEVVQDQVDKLVEGNEELQKAKKPKQNKYGITPGISPYPDFPMPTIKACQEVNDLLSEVHGVVEQPKTIPPPSLEVTGCGEVPSVLDALIRTRLSAATSSTNSAYAFAGLVSRFGILQDGIGKGSVNWNKVREADVKDIETAIKRGGLAAMKSKSIKEILDMVHEQNIARREAFIKEKETGEKVDLIGGKSLQQGQKDMEIASANQDILSLQFMHGLTPDEAMNELTKYPGIGVKTASCVILFCLRRPSFAVDTHVFRLCKWLKWIPENATRDKAFSHCEVRVPNELKYSLHQLFIRHGKTCGRCRASTGETSDTWKETVCPIEHLVERSGRRKMFKPEGKVKKESQPGSYESDSELSVLDESLFAEYDGNTEASPVV